MSIINSVIKGKQPVIDTLNVTPTTSAQQITAPQGTDGYSPVNISAVTSSIDANIVAGNIKKDVQILGVTGSYEGTVPTGTVNITSNGTHNVSSYEYAEVLVPTTAPAYYIEKTKDANNKLVGGSTLINLSGVEDVGDYQLAYAYYDNTNITGTVDLSSLTSISGNYAVNTIQKEREAEWFEIQEWIGILEAVRKSVNVHEKQIDELQMKVEPKKCEIPVDQFAEQRNWEGKL